MPLKGVQAMYHTISLTKQTPSLYLIVHCLVDLTIPYVTSPPFPTLRTLTNYYITSQEGSYLNLYFVGLQYYTYMSKSAKVQDIYSLYNLIMFYLSTIRDSFQHTLILIYRVLSQLLLVFLLIFMVFYSIIFLNTPHNLVELFHV